MLNILYVFGGEKASGAEIVIKRLFDRNKLNHPILLLSPGSFASNILDNGEMPGSIYVLPRLRKLNRSSTTAILFYLRAITNYIVISYKVLNIIRARKIDVVHSNTIVPASYLIPAILFSKLFMPKIRWYWSDHDLTYYSRIDIFMSKVCSKLYDNTLCVSEAVRKKYSSNVTTSILYNGLDSKIFVDNRLLGASKRKNYNLPSESIIIGLPATIGPRKGQVELIQAFKKITLDRNVILVFAGRFAEDYPEYQLLYENLIDDDKVRSLGHVTDMVGFYSMCDIIINNSNLSGSEPLGTTIYEAMSCEKVVICSATGGSPEIVTDGINGFLFQAENEESLIACLQNVITNYEKLNPVREKARIRVIEKFNIDTMVSRYNQIISDNGLKN